MKLMKKIVKNFVINVWRFPLKVFMRSKLKANNFIIISSNCVGGVLLHDIGKEFSSPTINLVIPQFVTFCENLDKYLEKQPVAVKSCSYSYPVFKIDEIEIRAVHYRTEDEFLDAWNRRKERYFTMRDQGAEIVVLATDTQLQEENAFERFRDLPFRKVAFVANYVEYPEFVVIPSYKGEKHVGDLTKYIDIFGRRQFEKYFDCVKFLNNK